MVSTTSDSIGGRVCVVGTGMIGLLAIKNLLEQGLDVKAYEKNDWIGGLWHSSLDPEQTTTLPITTMNSSKQGCSYTDFPYPGELPTHPPAKEVENYFISYAKHFNLFPHIRFSKVVTKLERDDTKRKWLVWTRNTAEPESTATSQAFDRVVFATGMLNTPHFPTVSGIENFKGEAIHSRAFKDPIRFKGKNVLSVGIGATGADTISFLKQGGAAKIYLSHRGQFYLLPRMVGGKAFDHDMNRRAMNILRWIARISPWCSAMLISKVLIGARKKAFPQLDNHPSFLAPRVVDLPSNRIPIFSEDLADNLCNGIAQTTVGIKEISGPRSVTMTDGTVLDDIDAIIFCSGYGYDFGPIPASADPRNPEFAPDGYRRMKATKYYNAESPFARLYRGFLSERYPESLAFLGHLIFMKPPFVLYDLVTTSLAQLWIGGWPLPSAQEMKADIDRHYNITIASLNRGPVAHPGFRMDSRDTYLWLNEVAGTGVPERLGGWGREAWKLWWNDRKFYNLLMDGLDCPPVYRLFDTGRGRKVWPGARQAIIDLNQEVTDMEAKWKKEREEQGKQKTK